MNCTDPLTAPNALADFTKLNCTKPYHTGEYTPPTAEQVGALIKLVGWTQREVAFITGVTVADNGSSTVRKWKTSSKKDQRQIPYAAWRLLLECAGLAKTEDMPTNLARFLAD